MIKDLFICEKGWMDGWWHSKSNDTSFFFFMFTKDSFTLPWLNDDLDFIYFNDFFPFSFFELKFIFLFVKAMMMIIHSLTTFIHLVIEWKNFFFYFEDALSYTWDDRYRRWWWSIWIKMLCFIKWMNESNSRIMNHSASQK